MDKKIGFPKFNLKNSRKSYVTNYFMKFKVISVDSKENFKITTFYKLTDTEKEIVEIEKHTEEKIVKIEKESKHMKIEELLIEVLDKEYVPRFFEGKLILKSDRKALRN